MADRPRRILEFAHLLRADAPSKKGPEKRVLLGPHPPFGVRGNLKEKPRVRSPRHIGSARIYHPQSAISALYSRRYFQY